MMPENPSVSAFSKYENFMNETKYLKLQSHWEKLSLYKFIIIFQLYLFLVTTR